MTTNHHDGRIAPRHTIHVPLFEMLAYVACTVAAIYGVVR